MSNGTVTVEIKSAWYSKINWLAVIGAVGTLVTTNALGLEPATQVKVLAAWTLTQNGLTMVFRTWFNGTVSPGSIDR